jgi:hypothetical protein
VIYATDHDGENAGGVEPEPERPRPSTPVASERSPPLGVHIPGYSPQVNRTVKKPSRLVH